MSDWYNIGRLVINFLDRIGIGKVQNWYISVFIIYYYQRFTVTSTEGLTATCAAALGLPNLQGLRPSDLTY